MEESLMELLCCPECKGELELDVRERDAEAGRAERQPAQVPLRDLALRVEHLRAADGRVRRLRR
jgi:uncharacterized protein YbaR (Trm112 family)